MADHSRRAQPVAVVTGASSGIGRATAARLAAAGFHVWALARRAQLLEELQTKQPDLFHPVGIDLVKDDLCAFAVRVRKRSERVDALVHCAGQIAVGPLLGSDMDDLTRLFDVNTAAPYRLTRAILPLLGSGSTVVFMNSSQGLSAGSDAGSYAAAKHALRAVADAMRSELNPRGVRVTSIYPGRTATPLQADLYRRRQEPYHPELLVQPESIAELIHTVVMLPAEAEVTDLSVRPVRPSY
jgi:NADP-dependent 3-hydroxy acid dehydrogenase YdfG